MIGVLESVHGFIGFRLAGVPGGGFTMPEYEVTWVALLSRALPSWVWMGLIVPLVIWMGRRLPLHPRMPKRHLALHLLGALVFGALFVVGASTIRFSFFVGPADEALLPTVMLRYYAIYYNLFFGYYWLIVGVYSALLYYRQAREREAEKRQLEEIASRARLESLRRQLDPHFLFNVLNGISSMVLEGSRQRAVRSLSDLSEILRVSFSRNQPIVSLQEELDLLDMYIDLQRVRLDDRLRFRVEIDPAAADAQVPSFLLQPLVENAIEHGVARRAGGGEIELRAVVANGRVTITITNPVGNGRERVRPGTGVGLANTRERIAHSYPGEGGLEFTVEKGRAMARISIPYRPRREP